jgi:hypothetical protein
MTGIQKVKNGSRFFYARRKKGREGNWNIQEREWGKRLILKETGKPVEIPDVKLQIG